MKRPRKSPESGPADENVHQAPGDPAIAQTAPAPSTNDDAAARLTQEIKELRQAVSNKAAELRALRGQAGGESEIVRRVLELLSRTEGATKVQVVEETGAKKGYVDALLSRILPEKGYVITATAVSGQRAKIYRIP